MRYYTNVACMGNHIYYRGVENGRRVTLKREYSPLLFVPSRSPSPAKYHDLHGHPVEEIKFESIKSAKEWMDRYKDVEDFTIYGNSRFEYTFIADQHPEETIDWNMDDLCVAYLDIEVGTADGMPDMDVCANPVTAITVKFSNNSYYHVFGCGDYTQHRGDIRYYKCADEEDLLERFLILWSEQSPDVVSGWNVKLFDIPYLVGRICAIPGFGEAKAKLLSPWGFITAKEETFYNKPQRVYKLLGISTLDYMQLFRKYASNSNQESYSLNHIAHVELKEKKIDYSEYDSLHHLFTDNFQKFIEYNIHDVELVIRLNSKSRLIEMALTLAYDNKTNYDDVFSQVRMWDTICYNHLRRKNIVIPPKKEHKKLEAYAGAYVKEPQIGMHKWVVSFDLNSLYPHLIMQYNLSPDMLIEPSSYTDEMRELLAQGVSVSSLLDRRLDLSNLHDVTLTPNGQFFHTHKQGFLAEIMETMYKDRVRYKKQQLESQKEKEKCSDSNRKKELENLISRYKNLQLAKKVGLNSAYGAMGNEHFRFFDIRIAEGVTLAGQLSIRWIERQLNGFMNKIMKTSGNDYVIASDTDSIYLNLGPLAQMVWTNNLTNQVEYAKTPEMIEWMDKACGKIQEFIDKSYQDLATYVHAYAQKMQMKRESLVDTAIWTAKKRYILNVWDQEGVRYKEPELKIQGLEAIKSSTPAACRLKIKEALNLIVNGTEDDVISFIEKFRKEFHTLPLSEIAFPRTVNGLELERKGSDNSNIGGWASREDGQVFIKGTPIHVKGALMYNHLLKKKGLTTQYELIRSGEKIKFIYLKEPNGLGIPAIAFLPRYPKEVIPDSLIDYRMQFEKSFVDPLRIVLDAIGWHTEKTITLDEFFS